MAHNGRIFIPGSGEQKTNPVHGEDLAEICADAIDRTDREIQVGGPQILTYNEIARLAFETAGREPRITRIPNWVRVTILKLVRTFTNSRFYGPIEFFLTVTAIDMIAPEYGTHRLKDHFASLRNHDT